MKRNKKRILVAILAICALAAGGAAFTANIAGSPDNAVAGFHQTQINGAHASSVLWKVTSDGQWVNEVDLTLGQDGTNGTTLDDPLAATDVVKAGFDLDHSGTVTGALVTCTSSDQIHYVCDMTQQDNADYPNGIPVQQATVFNVSVTDNSTAVVQ